jgi:hypothetical protein
MPDKAKRLQSRKLLHYTTIGKDPEVQKAGDNSPSTHSLLLLHVLSPTPKAFFIRRSSAKSWFRILHLR